MSAFTDREMKLMACAWQCFEEQPKINFDKLAGLVGMTNPRSASNAWASIKKKLAAQAVGVAGDADGDAATPNPKTAKFKAKITPKKRGKKASDEDDEEEEEVTPAAKKPRSARKASAASKSYNEESAEEKDDDVGAGATVKAEADEDGEDFLA